MLLHINKITKNYGICTAVYKYRKIVIHSFNHHSFTSSISIDAVNESIKSLFYLAQSGTFCREYVILSQGISPKSRILLLDPFLDCDNLITVIGKLSASDDT